MLIAQILSPVACLWCYGLAVGRGYTAYAMRVDLMVNYLAPAGYGMFLFQQTIGQIYYVITREGAVWLTPKIILWFSPIPLPVPFWEFWVVVTLTILASVYVVPLITQLVSPITYNMLVLGGIGAVAPASGDGEEGEILRITNEELVLLAVETITGLQDADPDLELRYALGSMDAVLLTAELNRYQGEDAGWHFR
jgi:hypothetical protein